MNLYRIHYAWKSGGASSSEIAYYEREESFKSDLLGHHLDIQIEDGRARNGWLDLVLASAWRKHRGNDDDTRRTTRLIKVERVQNDEWVSVEYEFIKPEVRLS